MKNKIITLLLAPLLLFSCVSSKKFKQAQNDYSALQTRYDVSQSDLSDCNSAKAKLENDKAILEGRIADMNAQIEFLKENNTVVMKQLQDMSVLTSAQAESISKSLESLGLKDAYIMDMQQAMAKKDSLNLALVMNLKGAIGNLDDQDINIKVDKGVVYIDISDKLLFKSGKYDITPQAKEVLGKVALVLKNQPDIEFMVEGHTDNVPYSGNAYLIDNWDLSVKRATAVVRILQNEYGMDPAKMAASGRSEYNPIASNDTAENKAVNRRTRIVILPQLDQFFKLLETPKDTK